MASNSAGLMAEVSQHGYVLIDHVAEVHDAEEILQRLGEIVPQYDGRKSHEIRATPGYEGMIHSKTMSDIYVHTEAPGWDPVPRYLALYSHAQARCGGGHTTLCDGLRLLEDLSEDEKRLVYKTKIDFPGPYGQARKPAWTIRESIASQTSDGDLILRFSYTHLTFGDYTPPAGKQVASEALPLGKAGVALASHATRFFEENHLPILIPDKGLLIWDNWRMLHGRSAYTDKRRHLTRYFVQP